MKNERENFTSLFSICFNSLGSTDKSADLFPVWVREYSSGPFGGGYCQPCEGHTESYCELEHPPNITHCDDGRYGCEDKTEYDECMNICVNGAYDGILDALYL